MPYRGEYLLYTTLAKLVPLDLTTLDINLYLVSIQLKVFNLELVSGTIANS